MAKNDIPQLRIPRFSYDDMPLDWLAGNPLASCMGNALHMLFPAGEQFFVRSVMHFKEQLRRDPELWQRVRGFAGQEGQHGYQHERVFEILRAQGVPVDAFLRLYQAYAFDFIEKHVGSKRVHLSTTVAAEHITATLARLVLTRDAEVFGRMSPEMASLLRWHAMEELEHQHVAWDALQSIDDSYALRMAGVFFISVVLFPFWIGGGAYFAWKRPEPLWKLLLRSRGVSEAVPLDKLLGALGEYLRRDYTPGKPGDDELIAQSRAWYERASEQDQRAAA